MNDFLTFHQTSAIFCLKVSPLFYSCLFFFFFLPLAILSHVFSISCLVPDCRYFCVVISAALHQWASTQPLTKQRTTLGWSLSTSPSTRKRWKWTWRWEYCTSMCKTVANNWSMLFWMDAFPFFSSSFPRPWREQSPRTRPCLCVRHRSFLMESWILLRKSLRSEVKRFSL